MLKDKSPVVLCPFCASLQIVKLQETLSRIFYFCFDCGKGFRTSITGGPPEPAAIRPA